MKLATALISTVAFAVPAMAQDAGPVDMAAVPAPVIEAAQAAVSGVVFDTANIDADDDTLSYELSGVDANGKKFEVDALADGTIEEVEEEVIAEDLPAEVKTAMEVNLDGMTPTLIEKSTRDGGQPIFYEFEADKDGKMIHAEVGADGANWVVSEDADS